MGKVLVTGTSVRPEILSKFKDFGLEFEVVKRAEDLSQEELSKKFNGADAYLCGGDERTAKAIYTENPQLKVISFLGVGYAAFMNETDATEAGIAITNTPGTLTESVAEATVALTLALNRRVVQANMAIQRGEIFETKCSDVCEKTVGVLGMGTIGRRVAQALAKGFGCKILYHNRNRLSNDDLDFDADYVSKNELFLNSDVIIVMVTGSPENYGLIGKKELDLVRNGTLLVNTARPEIVDGAALADALNSGQLGGVGIDGYYNEDDFDISHDEFGLLSSVDKNVVVTPHFGSLTHNARDKMGEMAVNSIIEFLETGSTRNIVNTEFRKKSRWGQK